MNFSVNVSTIFTEVPFLTRLKKAREAGFQYIECQFPYDFSVEKIGAQLAENELTLTLINCPPGNWETGDRGLAIDPSRAEEFTESIDRAIDYAIGLKVNKIHCMAGILPSNITLEEARKTYIKNINYAAGKMSNHDITLLIEPINSYDMAGYFLSSLQEAVGIIEEMNLPNVKLQYDFYHMQRIEGNLISNFLLNLNRIGHVQIADCPGRHEPGTGEIDYENIFRAIENSGYEGFVGLEYFPKGASEDSFTWLSKWRKGERV